MKQTRARAPARDHSPGSRRITPRIQCRAEGGSHEQPELNTVHSRRPPPRRNRALYAASGHGREIPARSDQRPSRALPGQSDCVESLQGSLLSPRPLVRRARSPRRCMVPQAFGLLDVSGGDDESRLNEQRNVRMNHGQNLYRRALRPRSGCDLSDGRAAMWRPVNCEQSFSLWAPEYMVSRYRRSAVNARNARSSARGFGASMLISRVCCIDRAGRVRISPR